MSFRKWVENPRADGKLTEAKVGFDATKLLEVKGKNYEKARFPDIDWRKKFT